ncbi:uncharacterized protein F5147DRAFT_768030 [Suillus discolor]|uniref:Uncharacterized protein n=1 Tax=Suillus discolor TaxID=1912936 RepID=A0A9P7JZF7_9AGAM|nr:uncharacterized protein F5147DRAFT_768030 [Suillus discolor]KAG2117889.1 hypothetical protein F5147DRAFT_768030 [Suillus discolor]
MVNNYDESQSDIELDAEEIPDTYLNDSGLCSRLIDLAMSIDDNPHNETWLSPKKAKRVAQRVPRPKFYKKGPDVGSKSAQTQRQYKELLQNQKSLTSLGFTVLTKPSTSKSAPSAQTAPLSKSPNNDSSASDLDSEDAGHTVPASEDSELTMGLASNFNAEKMWEDDVTLGPALGGNECLLIPMSRSMETRWTHVIPVLL